MMAIDIPTTDFVYTRYGTNGDHRGEQSYGPYDDFPWV